MVALDTIPQPAVWFSSGMAPPMQLVRMAGTPLPVTQTATHRSAASLYPWPLTVTWAPEGASAVYGDTASVRAWTPLVTVPVGVLVTVVVAPVAACAATVIAARCPAAASDRWPAAAELAAGNARPMPKPSTTRERSAPPAARVAGPVTDGCETYGTTLGDRRAVPWSTSLRATPCRRPVPLSGMAGLLPADLPKVGRVGDRGGVDHPKSVTSSISVTKAAIGDRSERVNVTWANSG